LTQFKEDDRSMREASHGKSIRRPDATARDASSDVLCECVLVLIVSGLMPLGCAVGQERTPDSGQVFDAEWHDASHRSTGRRNSAAADTRGHALDLRAPEVHEVAPQQFRSFGPSLRADPWNADPWKADDAANVDAAAPSLATNSTLWQRIGEARARNGVRLLTLWKSTWSTLSLQAGRHGGPSLQWTSSQMNHDGAKSGLFDSLFPVGFDGETPHAAVGTHATHFAEHLHDVSLDPFGPAK
jgi:hypothetical protein